MSNPEPSRPPVFSSRKKGVGKKHSPHSWKETLHFVSRFIAKPHAVGSVLPSSRYLARAMMHGIFLKPGDVVIEYGPGTGPFTQLLRAHVAAGVHYLGIERDRKLCKSLQKRFPEMHFHHGSAEEAPTILKQHQLPPAALIISGLPFANMPGALQERILNATQQALKEEGIFRTFTYLFSSISPQALHFRKMVLARFHQHHPAPTVMFNFPPARVLSFSHPVTSRSDE